MKKLIAITAISIFVFSCSPKTAPTASKTTTTETAQAKPVDAKPIAAVDMVAAEGLFKSSCGGCHDLPKPDKHSASEWPGTMDRMQEKAQFSNSHKEQILAYLVAHARPY